MRYLSVLLLLLLSTGVYSQQSNKSKSKDRFREKKPETVLEEEQQKAWARLAAEQLRPVTFALSEVMLHDVANPPAASRFYAYSLLAGYELAARYDGRHFPTLQASLRELPVLHCFTAADSVFYPYAALYAVLETGKGIMPSGQLLAEKQQTLEQLFRERGLSETLLAGSAAAARAIASGVLAYARTDGYLKLTALPRYRPGNTAAAWQPTPPDWMAAIEPNWNTLRPFFLDSAQQFRPPEPVPFDTATGSAFMRLVREVYDTCRTLSTGQREIAEFWDCNPFAVQHSGHLMIGLKKISPAGHWMNICGQVCEQKQVSFTEGLRVHSVLALAMADAFISCWDEKYHSSRIRPVTVINRLLDARWQPLLQTPPFPEYTSGHSTVSAAAAEVLTYFLGDNLEFTDRTEMLYGMPPRSFRSFRQAAAEASISRLYGGIHFRDALDAGLSKGTELGKWVLAMWPVVK